MTQLPPNTDIFRFVAIRNPSIPDPKKRTLIRISPIAYDSEFPAALIAAWKGPEPYVKSQDVTKNFIVSEKYLFSTALRPLAEAAVYYANTLRSIATAPDGIGVKVQFMSLADSVRARMSDRAQLVELIKVVWSSYVAAVVGKPRDVQAVSDAADCIRVLYFFTEYLDLLSAHPAEAEKMLSPEAVREIMSAEIVVPEELLGPPAEVHEKTEKELFEKHSKIAKARLDSLQKQVDLVSQLKAASEQLELSASIQEIDLVVVEKIPEAPAEGPAAFSSPMSVLRYKTTVWEKIEKTSPKVIEILDTAGLTKDAFDVTRADNAIRAVLAAEHRQLPILTTQSTAESGLFDPITGLSLAIGLKDGELEPPLGHGRTRILGIGDLKVVRQRTLKYAKGELAHIENVLAGEEKSRTHSRTERTEEVIETEEERSSETEKDTQSTERFEMTEETSNTIKRDTKFDAGVTVTATYGPVSISAHANFTSSQSLEESQKKAKNYARDVVNRTVEKVSQKIRQRRSKTTVYEVQEVNLHRLVALPDKHTVGVYRWVDKWYHSQVYNYGLRLMLEFVVPEPAAMYRYSLTSKNSIAQGKAKPLPPKINGMPLSSPAQITATNYGPLLSLYPGTQSVDAPPERIKVVSKSVLLKESESANVTTADATAVEIDLTDDYFAKTATTHPGFWSREGNHTDWKVMVFVGNNRSSYTNGNTTAQTLYLASIRGKIPVSLRTFKLKSALFHVTVTGELIPAKFTAWQHAVYQAVMDAYKRALDNYEGSEIAKGIQIQGQAPDANRDIERTELKRWCIEFLRRQQTNFGSMQEPSSMFPYIQFDRAFAEGGIAQFFEQAFEWEQLTYLFYPYMWAKQQGWVDMVAQNDPDPLFKRFLAAGFARCVAPVRPGYEKALMYFLKTGEIWEGGEPPVIEDPSGLYVSIVDSLKELDKAPDEGVAEGDPWEVKLPTSLVMLDDKPELPDWSSELQKPQSGVPNYEPSADACDGEHYNLKLWPKDGFAIHREYRLLGYDMPDTGNPIADMAAAGGKVLIQSFQRRIKQIKVDLKVTPTAVNDACTLVALTYARELRINGQWPGTWGPIS
jgi:hypothetical protein